MKKEWFIIFFLFIILAASPEIKGQTVDVNVSVTIIDLQLTIISTLNQTYSVSNINFNITSNENLSFCMYTLDDWINNVTMERNNVTSFGYATTLANGQYTVKYWCNNSVNLINNFEKVTFAVSVPVGNDDSDDDSGDDSGGDDGGGGGSDFPPSVKKNVTDQNTTQNITLPFGMDCIPGACNLSINKWCNDIGQWIEILDYCEKCQDDLDCEEEKEGPKHCENGICEKSLGENAFSCFNDCKYDLLKNLAALIITLVLLIVLGIKKLREKEEPVEKGKIVEKVEKQEKEISKIARIFKKPFKSRVRTEYEIKGRTESSSKSIKEASYKPVERVEEIKPQVKKETLPKLAISKPKEKYKELLGTMPQARAKSKYVSKLNPYVKSAMSKGYSKSQIKKILLSKNWPKDIIEDALEEV
ncbi:MAG: hypothetical protein ABIH72_04800 [archaeon]